jgi:hypothetical protein
LFSRNCRSTRVRICDTIMAVMAWRLDSGIGAELGTGADVPGTEAGGPGTAGSTSAGPGCPQESAGHNKNNKASRDAQLATMQRAPRALRSFLD